MLHIKNFSKSFSNQRIYTSFELTIDRGEFVSILGRSGVGKSVLLREIIKRNPSMHIDANAKLALVLQKPMVMNWLTAKNNILLGNKDLEGSAQFDSIVKALNLEEHLHKYPNEMSGGMIQRVALARQLIKDADIYLCDEPLSSVDEITAHFIREELKQLLKGKTVIWVTHNIREALSLSSRVLVLGNEGSIMLDSNTDTVTFEQVMRIL